MDAIGGVHVIVLDEVDHLVRRSGDDILYTLANLNTDLRNARCCLIGISNDLSFTDELDPRVTSRLGQEDLVFTPYNASQLEVILTERATAGIKADVLGGGVVSLCAALAAKEHGDARRALDLLRLAVHKAEQEAVEQVDVSHVRKAQSQLEFDQITPVIASLPLHSKFVLFSILTNESNGLRNLPTGLVYQVYEMACSNASENCLTGRSISTLISALDTLGLITAQTISKGRYGRSKQINSCIPKTVDPIDVMIGAEPTMIDVAAATYRLQGRLRT
jgi:cell division control protein 6